MARRRRSLLLLFSLSFQVGSRVLPAAVVISLSAAAAAATY